MNRFLILFVIMKWPLLTLGISLLALEPKPVTAQSMNIGIGYNVGVHTKVGGLDYVVGRYNDTRPQLVDKMEKPRFFRGMNYAWDVYLFKSLMSFEWVGRKTEMSANGTFSNGDYTRDLKLKMNSFNFGLASKLGKKAGVVGNYLGLDFNLISVRNYTRLYRTGMTIPEYEQIELARLSLGVSPFLQHVGRRFTTKIYFQKMFVKSDYWGVNRAINSSTWSSDNVNSLKGNSGSLGFSLRYNLVKNGGK